MRIGVIVGHDPASPGLDGLVSQVSAVAEAGFDSAWMSQIFGFDALTALAVVGRQVPGIGLGTAVVPTYPRHPMTMADQALTTQAATGGRLSLGIGLSHRMVIEGMFGYSFDKPLRHMSEYLSVLLPLVREGSASFVGETLRWTGAVDVPGAEPFPVLVAALGPQMLSLAGRVADGTVTWMTGPATIAAHVAPSITAAASRAGRPSPQVVVGLPVCVTDDAAAGRRRAAELFAGYGELPSYRAMLDREGAAGPADVVVVGDEAAVRASVAELSEAGATTFIAAPFGTPEENERTLACLATLT